MKVPNRIEKILYFPVIFSFLFYSIGSLLGRFLSFIGILPKEPPALWIGFSAFVSISIIVVTWRKGMKGPWSDHLNNNRKAYGGNSGPLKRLLIPPVKLLEGSW